MKKLPVGIQTFRKIAVDDYIYADKTEYIYRLIQEGNYYFLSRPRRFGKSLLVDTMKELFTGERALFKGLWIDSSDYDFKKYPVIRLDMSQVDTADSARLTDSIMFEISKIADTEEIKLLGNTPANAFTWIIESLRKKYGERVVVLIDEYDKPIIDHMGNPAVAEKNREVIGNFYGVLKGQDANLRFVFLTGVSKFTKMSLFSKLNNLTDLTLWDKYAGICGFTETEFDALFTEHIEAYKKARRAAGGRDGERDTAVIRRDILAWYDGYTWDGKTHVLNPFSLLSFFNKNQYGAYWFTTGAPQFLMGIFQKSPENFADVQTAVITESILDTHDIENAPLVSLLFQTGFLTVASTEEGPPRRYRLGFPNIEVSQSFSELFLSTIIEPDKLFSDSFIEGMRKSLDAGEPEKMEEFLRGLYASIPYQLHIPKEAFYQVIFLAIMQFLGFRVLGEISTAEGRVDGVIDLPNGKSYVIEFKYRKAPDGATGVNHVSNLDDMMEQDIVNALAQVDDRGYADRYSGAGREVYKVAIAVSGRGKVRVRSEKL